MAPNSSDGDLPKRVQAIAQKIPWHENFKFAPKVMMILDEMGRHEEIVPTLDAGVTDYWLPMPHKGTLPPELDPAPCKHFIKTQSSFLDPSFELNCSHSQLHGQAMAQHHGKRLPKTLAYKRILGRGGFAYVVEVEAPDGKRYALKQIPRKKHYVEAKGQLKSIKEEIEILKKIDHEHCIKFMGSYGDAEDIGVVMDPVADCNLESFLDDFDHGKQGNYMILASFFGCLAGTLEYLHYKVDIRHKDIKPQNILVKEDRVILTDFGISLDWGERGHSTTREEERRSPIYCAPEAGSDQPRNSRSDIWSMGCVFLEMCAVLHNLPSSYAKDKLSAYGCENFRDCPDGIRDAISDLRLKGTSHTNVPLQWIEAMLQLENKKRWTSKELGIAISKSKGKSRLAFCGMCCNEFRSEPSRDAPPSEEMDWEQPQLVAAPMRTDRTSEPATLYDDKTGSWHHIVLTRHSSVSENWISRHVVELYDLDIIPTDQRATANVEGQQLVAVAGISVTFGTADDTDLADFFVTSAPASFDLLVGTGSGAMR